MTCSTSERVAGARDKSKPTVQYTRKSKDKSTHAKTRQGQRLATHKEEEEQQKTSSSSKSGSQEGGEQRQNEEAYEGSDDGVGGGGHDNINVYYGPSEPAGGSRGWGRGEGNEPSDEYPRPHQMASSPWITSSESDSSYGYGQQYGHQLHDPSSEYGQPQQYGGYGGPSYGYGQQQYGALPVPMAAPPQVQPPYAYPQLQVMAPSSNYGEGPITPRAGQGFFHFDVAQYYRQSQNNDEDEDLEPARHSTWN